MRQDLTTDTVDRYIEARPEALYGIIADVTRTPEYTPDIVRVEWLDGATGRGPDDPNMPQRTPEEWADHWERIETAARHAEQGAT